MVYLVFLKKNMVFGFFEKKNMVFANPESGQTSGIERFRCYKRIYRSQMPPFSRLLQHAGKTVGLFFFFPQPMGGKTKNLTKKKRSNTISPIITLWILWDKYHFWKKRHITLRKNTFKILTQYWLKLTISLKLRDQIKSWPDQSRFFRQKIFSDLFTSEENLIFGRP